MADVAQAKRTVQVYEGALSTTQQDLTAQQNIQTSFQNKANALNDKAAGLPNGSDEQQATLEKATNYQSQANNQAQFVTRAQDNVSYAQRNLDSAKQDLVTAQQQQDQASSQTASDAVADKTSDPKPATQNTGTDSGGSSLSAQEQKSVAAGENQSPSGDQSNTPVPATDSSTKPKGQSIEDGTTPNSTPSVKVGPKVGSDIFNIIDSINPNPLSDYASYTYNLNLHVLTSDDYHTMVNDPTNFTPSRNLISGANRYNTTYNPDDPDNYYTSNNNTLRDPAFTDDFYFDELKMKTIIGLNAESGATNAIEITFTIIEPYGMTLLDRMLDINTLELNVDNYLEMPYLLEINFFGVGNNGKSIQIPDTTKFIPIKIIGFKIKAGVKGSEYSVQAVPFNHQANFASAQDIPANFGVTASTVGSFFASGILTADQQSKINSAAPKPDNQHQTVVQESSTARPAPQTSDPNQNTAIIITTGTSLTAAINAWNQNLATTGNIDYADKVSFVIDDEIANSQITDPTKNTLDNTPPVSPQTNAASNSAQASGQTTPDPITTYTGPGARVQANSNTDPRSLTSPDGGAAATTGAQSAVANPNAPDANTIDFGNSMFHLNAGTKIIQIIDMVMMNSQYILSQLQDPILKSKSIQDQQAAAQSPAALAQALNAKEVKWYKIIPEVHLDKFDKSRNVWGKTVTYNIQAYTYYNNKHPDLPKSPPPPAVKIYNYLYTGQNTEVITFDIDYNVLYFTALQANRGNTTALVDTKDGEEGSASKTAGNLTRTISPAKIGFKGGNAPGSSGLGWARAEVQAAHNVKQSIYSSAGGEQLQLKLQILGDPQFIKQDDIYYGPSAIKNLNLRGEDFINGSLATDTGELYCICTFQTPVDIDETTGLLRKDSKYYVSYFSGYYRVLCVDSEFRNGKFTQTLELVRYDNQANSGQPDTSDTYDAERNDDASVDAQYKANAGQPGGAENIDKGSTPISPPQPSALGIDDNIPGYGTPPTNPLVLPDGETEDQNTLLKNIAEKGQTLPIGTGVNADGSSIILA